MHLKLFQYNFCRNVLLFCDTFLDNIVLAINLLSIEFPMKYNFEDLDHVFNPPPQAAAGGNKKQVSNTIMLTLFALKFYWIKYLMST